MKKVQKGFTLIELMIVVAIIGILAAIAIPAYQDYITKSQMQRAVGELSALKTAVEEGLARNWVVGTVPVVPGNCGDIGFTNSTLTTTGCDVSETNNNFTYNMLLDGAVSGAAAGSTVELIRNATDSTWSCEFTPGAGGLAAKHLPVGCTLL